MTDNSDLVITCLEDIDDLMKKFGVFGSSGYHPIYRGQAKDWPLLSGLGRIDKTSSAIQELEQKLLSDFEDLVDKEVPELLQKFSFSDKFKEGKIWSLLFQAQHLRLPTRLLDWSSSIHTAVVFAVDSEPEFDGVLWMFKAPEILQENSKEEYLNLQLNQVDSMLTINHPFLSERDRERNIAEEKRSRQNGCFTIQSLEFVQIPLENQPMLKGQFWKVLIPKEAKLQLQNELAGRGKTMNGLTVKEDEKVDRIVKQLKLKYDLRERKPRTV